MTGRRAQNENHDGSRLLHAYHRQEALQAVPRRGLQYRRDPDRRRPQSARGERYRGRGRRARTAVGLAHGAEPRRTPAGCRYFPVRGHDRDRPHDARARWRHPVQGAPEHGHLSADRGQSADADERSQKRRADAGVLPERQAVSAHRRGIPRLRRNERKARRGRHGVLSADDLSAQAGGRRRALREGQHDLQVAAQPLRCGRLEHDVSARCGRH